MSMTRIHSESQEQWPATGFIRVRRQNDVLCRRRLDVAKARPTASVGKASFEPQRDGRAVATPILHHSGDAPDENGCIARMMWLPSRRMSVSLWTARLP